ncbi:MAG: RNA polymerase sigma factor [Ignavibacteria bacterium]|nr:RNA polymerase sigma factor [Ignavibacteria bacterium]
MLNKTDDYDLVRKFISGDEQAFNLLVSRHQNRIYWHARRMVGNHDDADEIVQEVLLVMYQKLRSFNYKSALYTWIYKITSTRSLNLLKKNKIKRMISFDSENNKEISASDDVIVNIEQKEKFEKMQRYLKNLPAKQREIFIFRNFDDLSYEEIADITGKAVGTLKANYFHAFNKLKELMDEYENK